MCGLAGFVDRNKSLDVLERMTRAVEHRGPDDSGLYLEDGVGMGHRRLSILDLSSLGHQPMRFEDLVMVYNGEVYNFLDVRRELSGLGYEFSSMSDSEVVLKAFHRWGPDCVNRFIGMFAIAVYDRSGKSMHLIRDRAGVKPLYYYEKDGRLAFASELKSFRTYLSPQERRRIDPDALSEYLSFGYISSGRSILRDVKKLPPGCHLKFAAGKAEISRYWDVSFAENPLWHERTEEDLLDELEDLAISAFKYRMVADVPVGVFLSAGVDSSLVTAVLARHHGDLRTFTIGFDEAGYDEAPDARKIAAYLGTQHTEGRLTSAMGKEMLSHYADIYDEPFGDSSGLPTSFVSALAKQNGVKVVLSADAGDELFGGYTRYPETMRRWRQVRPLGPIGSGAARLGFGLASRLASGGASDRIGRFQDLMSRRDFLEFYQNLMVPMSASTLRSIFPDYRIQFASGEEREPLNQMCEWDFKRYMVDDILVKVDRATMYHSIEGREPFLDHRLVEFAAQLPMKFKVHNGETKYLLKKLLKRYLPEELFRLPKRGFSAPMNQWIKDDYRELFGDTLANLDESLFDKSAVAKLLRRYRAGLEVNYSLIWYLFSFQAWYGRWNSEARESDLAAA